MRICPVPFKTKTLADKQQGLNYLNLEAFTSLPSEKPHNIIVLGKYDQTK